MTDDELFREIEALLFRVDPMGINFGDNPDEYGPEARTILERLPTAQSEVDVARIVHEEFVRWFDDPIVGEVERYRPIAAELWQLWSKLGHQ